MNILKRVILSLIVLLYACQNNINNKLEYNSYSIEIIPRILETDTIYIAYFDERIPRTIEFVEGNIGKTKNDLTVDSITNYVKRLNPKVSSIVGTDLSKDNIKFNETNGIEDCKGCSRVNKDEYYEDAINYYYKKTLSDSLNYEHFLNLSKAWVSYTDFLPLEKYIKVISYLKKVQYLNPKIKDAYLLEANLYEKWAVINGMLISEPHVNLIDHEKIKDMTKVLKLGLSQFPNDKELLDYLSKVEKLY